MTNKYIELDGSQGEGGGQVLRSALTLSMITGKPFRIERIRARRKKPGLLRQHLTAVKAATQICNATVEGAELGSQSLTFSPNEICSGHYNFAIGSAGSCTLVLQTVLPALWFANATSRVVVSGGTHNPLAPPADFLMQTWLPLMKRMGVQSEIALLRHGFFPAGGGEVIAEVTPVERLLPLQLMERGVHVATRAEAVVAGVPTDVALRELRVVEECFPGAKTQPRVRPVNEGPGNVVLLWTEHEYVNELFIAYGEKGLPAANVADEACRQAKEYLRSDAAVGEYLADQLLLPCALAGNSAFTTTTASSHLHTNIEVIQKFLDAECSVKQEKDDRWLVMWE